MDEKEMGSVMGENCAGDGRGGAEMGEALKIGKEEWEREE